MKTQYSLPTNIPCISCKVFIILFMILQLLAVATALFSQTRASQSSSSNDLIIYNQEMVTHFYMLNNQRLKWMNSDSNSVSLRKKLIMLLDSACYIGLEKSEYHYDDLVAVSTQNAEDSIGLTNDDKLFTDAALTFAKDLYMGKNMARWIQSDEISPSRIAKDKSFLVNELIAAPTDSLLQNYFLSLQPASKEYELLIKELYNKVQIQDSASVRLLNTSLNVFRWINHFDMVQCITVNIPSATLEYRLHDSIQLKMKVVVGKLSTPSPRMATYCTQIILYPYWNVPRKIAVNEFLPLFTLLPKMVDALNMQVLDKNGKIVDHHNIKWSSFNKDNFPYRLRQSTGCDNSLGVIKFNLTDPYDVYLHDTNNKKSFLSEKRFYSHGCIRIEKPIALARLLIDAELDTTFLQSGIKDQKPVPINVKEKVPVFVVYMPAIIDNLDKVIYYKDVYNLVK